MNITFLIGNGFDCAVGLKTRYSQFYKWYCDQPKDKLSQHVADFRTEIDKYIKKSPDAKPYWSDAEIGLGKYTENFDINTVEKFLDCYNDFHSKLSEYVVLQNSKVTDKWAAEVKPVFTSQLINFDKTVDPKEQPIFTQLKNKEKSLYANFNFITFNYTKALDEIYNLLGNNNLGSYQKSTGSTLYFRRGKLVHIHGYTDKYPILGVCSKRNIANQELLVDDVFLASMLKKDSIDASGELWRTNAFNLIDNSDIICIFGMSIGESDSDYWEKIMSWLDSNPDKHVVVFSRYSKGLNIETSISAKVREVKHVKNLLFEYTDWTEEKFDKIKDRIHIVFNSKGMFYLPKNLQIKVESGAI